MRAALAAVAGAVLAAPLAARAPAGLCSAGETVYFECAMAKGKTLAVCGAMPERLQYRFGRPGAIELAYPAGSEGPGAFQIARYQRYRTDRVALRFERGGVGYAVFDEQEDGRSRGGVLVQTSDGRVRDLTCVGPVTSRLGELVGVVPCDRESALTGGSCP